jgi:hypothetical protein
MFGLWGPDGAPSAEQAPAAASASGSPAATSTAAPKVSTLWYLFGVILVIVAFKWAVEHEKSGMEFSFVGISVYNWIAVGSLSFLFLVAIKVIFNKYQVPGLTDLINAA